MRATFSAAGSSDEDAKFALEPSLTVPLQPGCPAGDPGVGLLPLALIADETDALPAEYADKISALPVLSSMDQRPAFDIS